MHNQSDSTRIIIARMLQQLDMSDEELYQLLYGHSQQAGMEITATQLLNIDVWEATEHTPEELEAMQEKMQLLAQLAAIPPEELENLLEGELYTNESGVLLKKRYKNWRKGFAQFLQFLPFANLMKLATAIATETASNLIPQFEMLKNRPQDRRMLSDFILAQLENPTPPILAALAAGGVLFSPEIGEVEFAQPVSAAVIALEGEKLKQLRELMPEIALPELEMARDEHALLDIQKLRQQKQSTRIATLMNRLEVIERMEMLIAHKQMLHQAPETEQPQQQNLRNSNKIRTGPGRKTREREAQAQKQAQEHEKNMDAIMEGLKLDVFKGMTLEHVDKRDLGKTKSSIGRNHQATFTQNKPTPQIER